MELKRPFKLCILIIYKYILILDMELSESKIFILNHF